MPIPVVCQSCGVKLNAPDSAAGKRTKCPKCQAIMTIPSLPKPEPEPEADQLAFTAPAKPTPPAPKAKPKPPVKNDYEEPEMVRPKKAPPKKAVARDEDEEEEDGEDDDRPVKSKKGKKNPMTLVVIAIAVLLFLGGAGFGVWYFFLSDDNSKPIPLKPGPAATKPEAVKGPEAQVPAGWELYDRPEFRVLLPTGGTPRKSNTEEPKPDDFYTEGYSTVKLLSDDSAKLLMIGTYVLKPEALTLYETNTEKFFEEAYAKEKDYKNDKVLERKDIIIDGAKAFEMLVEFDGQKPGTRLQIGIRYIVAKGRLYQLSMMDEKVTFDNPMLKAFFESFASK
jgi:hypothetical protein